MKEDEVKIYIKPTCTTCRKALKILNEKGKDFEAINYYEKPFTRKKLAELIKKLNTPPKELLRKKDAKKDLSDSEVIDLMIKYPDLIQRPIVESSGRVLLARPAEEINKILKNR